MKILYIHQYFNTPNDTGGTRSYWISQKLIEAGHEITMLTSSRDGKKSTKRTIDGIEVVYLKVPYSNNMGVVKRATAFIKFMLVSSWKVLFGQKWDMIIATSTPLTVGLPALLAKKLRNTPYLFEVRDLWPDVPVQMGGLKNKFLTKLAYWFEKKIYHNASEIVALSPGMAAGVINAGISEKRVTTIPNMSKIDRFWPREKDPGLIKELGLREDSFKVVYFGAMGVANGMDYILDAAKFLKKEDNVEFVFLGGGSTEESLKERCENEAIGNMHFYGRVPMDRLSAIVNICDVSLVTFKNLPILYTNSPNKLFDSLSAGKPIIVNSPGWTKDLVESSKCGLYADINEPAQMTKQILKLKESPEWCQELGKNSRILAQSKYDKSLLCSQFLSVVENISDAQ
ncbi:glycosyltransferase family 4 protein [Flagellimonas eckloniae]|uniref:Glycosyl transferase family 1 n=1 Tax=Flagellimonas eckloniae TaxID=346185 RepID=A0A0Q0XDW1_9FLAO|nr:glycosyltransferase family 4 protein [Allomuricauda eckloniae]KQC29345.1 hypothetical protein AAY42_05070 [Allomuricauda eckloniae]